MSSLYGENLKVSIFGQSHGPAIGMTLDGIPAGLPVDEGALQAFLARRAPGSSDLSTPRKEADKVEFLSGIVDGRTCGAPIAAMIANTNTRSGDYANLKDCPRPGHADYTAQVKYRGYQDSAGGGHFSGRLTAPLCIAGGLCKQWLAEKGVDFPGKVACTVFLTGCDLRCPYCHINMPHLLVTSGAVKKEKKLILWWTILIRKTSSLKLNTGKARQLRMMMPL